MAESSRSSQHKTSSAVEASSTGQSMLKTRKTSNVNTNPAADRVSSTDVASKRRNNPYSLFVKSLEDSQSTSSIIATETKKRAHDNKENIPPSTLFHPLTQPSVARSSASQSLLSAAAAPSTTTSSTDTTSATTNPTITPSNNISSEYTSTSTMPNGTPYPPPLDTTITNKERRALLREYRRKRTFSSGPDSVYDPIGWKNNEREPICVDWNYPPFGALTTLERQNVMREAQRRLEVEKWRGEIQCAYTDVRDHPKKMERMRNIIGGREFYMLNKKERKVQELLRTEESAFPGYEARLKKLRDEVGPRLKEQALSLGLEWDFKDPDPRMRAGYKAPGQKKAASGSRSQGRAASVASSSKPEKTTFFDASKGAWVSGKKPGYAADEVANSKKRKRPSVKEMADKQQDLTQQALKAADSDDGDDDETDEMFAFGSNKKLKPSPVTDGNKMLRQKGIARSSKKPRSVTKKTQPKLEAATPQHSTIEQAADTDEEDESPRRPGRKILQPVSPSKTTSSKASQSNAQVEPVVPPRSPSPSPPEKTSNKRKHSSFSSDDSSSTMKKRAVDINGVKVPQKIEHITKKDSEDEIEPAANKNESLLRKKVTPKSRKRSSSESPVLSQPPETSTKRKSSSSSSSSESSNKKRVVDINDVPVAQDVQHIDGEDKEEQDEPAANKNESSQRKKAVPKSRKPSATQKAGESSSFLKEVVDSIQ